MGDFTQAFQVVSLRKLRAPRAPLETRRCGGGQEADAGDGCDVGVG